MTCSSWLATGFAGIIAAAGCSTGIPIELSDARVAYERASHGPAAKVAPAELRRAKVALQQAEVAFEDRPGATSTRALAYVAGRKAQLSEAVAARTIAQRDHARAEQGRRDAQRKTAEAAEQVRSTHDSLARLAVVKEEARGLVVTLSGSALFGASQAALLPETQSHLDQVVTVLLATQERNLTIEGHTDSRGPGTRNVALSQRRADAVRTYLVFRGYDPDRVRASGIGEDRPVGRNGSAEGRASNRRVEIIVAPIKTARHVAE
jgi:outer membrane protein OmpA-like peptidoglycan-associated protein